MEIEQAGAVRSAAFRKDGDVFPFAQYFCNFFIDEAGVATAAATQKNRVIFFRQPANQGPVSDFFLGNEGGRQDGIDDENIDPGNMIGDDQAARQNMA